MSGDGGGIVESPRLRLEPIKPDDADELAPVLADRALYRFIGGKPPSVHDLRTRFERWSVGHSADGTEEWRNWLVRESCTGQAVGTMQATIVEHGSAAWMGWLIGARWQGRGYATEAAMALIGWLRDRGVVIVRADIHPDHEASVAVARTIGLSETDDMVDGERIWERRLLGARH